MSAHSKQFHDKIRVSLDICFLKLSEKNQMGLQNKFELALVNESSVFELLWFDCKFIKQ